MTSYKLDVVPANFAPAPDATVMRLQHDGPLMAGRGEHNYVCGNCGRILLQRVDYGQVSQMLIQCGGCDRLNRSPDSLGPPHRG